MNEIQPGDLFYNCELDYAIPFMLDVLLAGELKSHKNLTGLTNFKLLSQIAISSFIKASLWLELPAFVLSRRCEL